MARPARWNGLLFRTALLASLLGAVPASWSRAADPGAVQESGRRYAADLSRMLGSRVQENLGYVREGAGTAKIRFTLNRAGHLVSARIEQSSGHPSYDMRLLGILLMSAPLPPLPAEIPDARMTFVAPIEINARRAPDATTQ